MPVALEHKEQTKSDAISATNVLNTNTTNINNNNNNTSNNNLTSTPSTTTSTSAVTTKSTLSRFFRRKKRIQINTKTSDPCVDSLSPSSSSSSNSSSSCSEPCDRTSISSLSTSEFESESTSSDSSRSSSSASEPPSSSSSSPALAPVSPASTVSSPTSASSSDESKSSPSSDSESESYPQTRTVIIFDWDDTLLCSTHLANKGVRLDTPIAKDQVLASQLKQLEKSVVSILTEAIQYGEVHIITNAESCWVELSAKKFIPAVLPLLAQVQVTSARSTFEKTFPNAPVKWKYHAFQHRLAPSFVNEKDFKNIICLGDSTVERDAVRAVTKNVPNTILKNIKFAERPSMDQLQKQIEMLEKNLEYICHHQGELDLMLTITAPAKAAAPVK